MGQAMQQVLEELHQSSDDVTESLKAGPDTYIGWCVHSLRSYGQDLQSKVAWHADVEVGFDCSLPFARRRTAYYSACCFRSWT